MNSFKCPECNLTNWVTAAECKRCRHLFQAFSAEPEPMQNAFGEQNFAGANQTSFDATELQQHTSWSPNQPYNQSNGQSNYQYNQPQNLKSGLAIASMVLGILGFVTSIFLIGILLAPIGLILGIVALVKANKKPHIYGGKGFAIAGIAMSAMIVLFVPIVAAIAIPNLLAARRSANEASAIASIRTLAGAEDSYMASQYTSNCGDLQTLSSKGLIDSVLARGEKSGYRFLVVKLPVIGGGCELHAVPLTASTGTRSFYFSTEDGIVRAAKKDGKYADKNDSPLDSYAPNYPSQPPKIASY